MFVGACVWLQVASRVKEVPQAVTSQPVKKI